MASTTGTIKRMTDKGFGFIAAPDGTEYFFHQSGAAMNPKPLSVMRLIGKGRASRSPLARAPRVRAPRT